MPENGDSSQAASTAGISGPGRQEGPALMLTGRAIQACDRCRFKKVRCDGAIPACGRCKRAGLECLTTVKLSRKSYPRSYTESIEERLRQLEAEVRQLKNSNDAKDRRIRELEAADRFASRPASVSQPGPTSVAMRRHYGAWKNGPRPSTDEPLSREVGRMNLDRRGTGRFMGSSSGIFFVGMAEQRLASINKMSAKVGDALLRVDVDDQTVQYPLQPQLEGTETSVVLPPRETAEAYIDNWFDAWKHIFPILHRPSFMKAVDDLYSQPVELRDPAFLALFFLVLALGCRHSVLTGMITGGILSVESTGEDIDLYCQSLKFRNSILALNNLMTLQFQELLTLWYLYTGKRSLAFQMTGSMTRLALELGLHRHTRRFHFDPLTTEMRKRTFWICYMLDNFLSAIEGLPKSFRDQDIDVELPSDVDDDFVNEKEYLLSLPGEPTGMLLFLSLVKVVRVLSNTLEILYTTTDRRQTVTKIKTIDRLLDQWAHTLPDHLQLDPAAVAQPPCDDARIEPAVAFLHLTYSYVRFAAHRVAISFHPTTPQYRTSLLKCMEIARELIYLNSHCQRHLLVLDVNPGSHVYTLWSCGLMSLFGLWEVKTTEGFDVNSDVEEEAKAAATTCVELLKSLVASSRDEQVRVDNLVDIITATWPDTAPGTQGPEAQQSQSQPGVSDPWPTTTAPQPNLSLQQAPSEQASGQPTPFTQLLQAMFMDPAAPAPPSQLPHHDPGPSTSRVNFHSQSQSRLQSQSPNFPRIDTPATASPPMMMEGFNIDFSSAFSHPYERFQSSTLPPAKSNSNGIPTMDSAHYYQGQQQQGNNTEQIWDDPIFNLASMVPAAPPEGNSPCFTIGENLDASPTENDGQRQPSSSRKKRTRADVDSEF